MFKKNFIEGVKKHENREKGQNSTKYIANLRPKAT